MSMEIKPGYKMTEVGVIPDEWDLVTAGQIGRFRGGNGFPLKFQGEVTGTYPFFKVSDMNNEGNETRMFVANNYISDITRKTLGATIFAENSIVFAKVGAAIFLERKRILAQPSCLDNNMTAFELDDKKADYRYVHHRLIHTRLSDLVSTTALPSLSGNVLSQIKFPLPMLEEQRAIASALSDVDVLLTEIDRLIAKKRDIQQAAMQQLLTGQRRLPGFSGGWGV
ncbi:restriction endonuclease subunit S, partial [Halopseudomonas pachastrellae]